MKLHFSYLILLLHLVLLNACKSSTSTTNELLDNKSYTIRVNTSTKLLIGRDNFTVSFIDNKNNILVPEHSNTGLTLSGKNVVAVKRLSIKKESQKGKTYQYEVTNSDAQKANVEVSILNDIVAFKVMPTHETNTEVSIQFGGMDLAHGLGDSGAYRESFNLVENKNTAYSISNNGGGQRWASTFTIFPKHNFGAVYFKKGKKQVIVNKQEYVMHFKNKGDVTFYCFLGSPKTIYKNYKSIRNQEGYTDVKPKFRLFELGWESWDALGWNTKQETVKNILEKFHINKYPIRWAVTGSGFWDEGGTTTSFGRWGEKFSDAKSMKDWMHGNDIKWMIGLRTNLIPEGGPYYPKTKKRDKNLKVKSFYGNKLTTDAFDKGYLVKDNNNEVLSITSGVFPIVPSYLVDGNIPGAAQWYQKQYAKWDVDGIKEDTMMKLDSLTSIYNTPVAEISHKGGLVMARNGEFTSLGTLLRINDTGVRELDRRIPINYFQYAASGFPNVYSDVAGVHNMHNIKDMDRNIRHTWLLALTSGLAVGAYPEKWSIDKQAIFKKAINFHYTIAPYMFSEAVKGFQSGYPTTLTPLSIAFPNDDLATSHQNFQWMIGESILATPLLKNHTSGKMDVYLPKGIWFDFETGEKYSGPQLLKDYAIPLEKTPVFIGGKGAIVMRDLETDALSATIYPVVENKTVYTFNYPHSEDESKITYGAWDTTDVLKVVDKTVNKNINFHLDQHTGSINFPIEPSHDYKVIRN